MQYTEVARLVVEHFRERGFRQFGFVGLPRRSHPAMDAWAEHFQRLVKQAGCQCRQLWVRIARKGDRWEKQCSQIARWLEQVPKPVAIMACNDDIGLRLLDACRRLDVPVPDQVIVSGVGNDPCLCALALPPLTSVDLNPRRIGREAAALLDRMMNGRKAWQREAVVAPTGIVARASTDVMATDDQSVVQAIRLIRQHACDGLRAADILKQVRMSRASHVSTRSPYVSQRDRSGRRDHKPVRARPKGGRLFSRPYHRQVPKYRHRTRLTYALL